MERSSRALFTALGPLAVGHLLAMLVVLGRAAAGAVTRQDHAGLEVVAYYWHFVDVVWIALFATLFVLK